MGVSASEREWGSVADIEQIKKDVLLPDKAPDSLVARYGLLTLKGAENLPSGMLHAAKEDLQHPVQTLSMVAISAGLGAAVKTLLPKAGPYGKAAGLAIGAYFAYRASEPFRDAFTIAGQAKNMDELDVAARFFGDAGGSLIVNSALSGAAYKLGGMGAERYLMQPKTGPVVPPTPEGLSTKTEAPPPTPTPIPPVETVPVPNKVEPRGGFWTATVMPNLPGAISIGSSGSGRMTFDPRLAGLERFSSSDQNPPPGNPDGLTDKSTELNITVQLKSKATDQEMEQTLKDIALGRRPPLTENEYTDKFGARKEALDELTQFANAYGLKVSETDMRSGRVVLSGSAEAFSEAFKTKIYEYSVNGEKIRARDGALFVPKSVARNIEGIFGIDNRPQATPRNRDFEPRANQDGGQSTPANPSFRADEVARAYNFPKDTTGKGQSAALIELGGGIDLQNEGEYYKAIGLKVPAINVVEFNGAKNATGKNLRADKEVAMDSQILGTVAPDAKQMIIFAPNSEQGFVDSIGRAIFHKEGESPNQAISVSWGQPTESWSAQGKRGMGLAMKKAALRGISVFVASGDDGASDGIADKKFHVDYPAADPYVTAVGGTALTVKDGKISSETTWNDHHGATGGGISNEDIPEYQSKLKMTIALKNFNGRALPDLAANASPATGYKIRVAGRDIISGGTSAVAPLYTGLVLRLNEALGEGKSVGFVNPFLYEHALSGKPQFVNDITEGNNNGYDAAKGWDPVTGWGSLDGEKLLSALKQHLRKS